MVSVVNFIKGYREAIVGDVKRPITDYTVVLCRAERVRNEALS